MAEMNLGGSTENVATPIIEGTTTNEIPEEADTSTVDASAPNVQVNEAGMSSEELNDANKIKVTIAEENPFSGFLRTSYVWKNNDFDSSDTILARKRLHHKACNVIQTDIRQEL